MLLHLIQYKKNKEYVYDITLAVTKFSWCGSTDQVSRSVEFSMPNAPYDKNLKDIPRVKMGDFLKLYDDNKKLIYYGMVYNSERTSDIGEVSYTTYDLLYHFTKSSWSKSFKNKTAEQIVAAACAEVGVGTGSLAKTGINMKLLVENETIFDTMLKAYKKASKSTGKKYHFKMSGSKLDVIVKGTNTKILLLTDEGNITKASIKESITDIINKVKIYDDKGNQKGVVSDADSVKKYGVFQSTYTEQKDVESKTAAKEQLKGATQEITIEAVGHLAAISGYSVYVQDGATGLTGVYWVIDDKHTFENGTHTMSLTLSYKCTTS